MNALDEQYTKTPFYGIRRMTAWLQQQGENINHKRVQRLMQTMGIYGLTPPKSLSKPNPAHKIYPYLLRNVKILKPDHVWSTDITYIRLKAGFVYLVAVIDWFSRYVLSWELSVSMESDFCCAALQWALRGGRPEIFNTDQGSQFTADMFVGLLLARGIRVSMDGRGRALDNVFVERLWRSVKYEDIFLKDYSCVADIREGLRKYFTFYNEERLHESLGYATPASVYFSKRHKERG